MKKILNYLLVTAFVLFSACSKDKPVEPDPDPTYEHMYSQLENELKRWAVDLEENDYSALQNYYHNKTSFELLKNLGTIEKDKYVKMNVLENTLKRTANSINTGKVNYTMDFRKIYSNKNPQDTITGTITIPVSVQAGEDKGNMANWDYEKITETFQ